MTKRPTPTPAATAKIQSKASGTHAGVTHRGVPSSIGHLTPEGILQLQRTVGNRAVGRLLQVSDTPPVSHQPPIQGLFKRYSLQKPKMTIWVDQDTDIRYMLDETVTSDKGDVLFYWVVPMLDRNADAIAIRAVSLGGRIYEKLTGVERRKVIKTDGKREETKDVMEEVDTSVPVSTSKSPPKKNLKRKLSDTAIEVVPKKERKRVIENTPEESEKTLKKEKNVRPGKLKSNLGVLVTLVPKESGKEGTFMPDIEEGKPLPTPKSGEYRFTPAQVVVNYIAMGNMDRPPTQFKNQERHTVAWTLARNGVKNLQGRTVSEVITYFQGALGALRLFIERSEATNEAKTIYAMVVNQRYNFLEIAQSGTVPLTVWADMLSRLIRLYMQAYQLSSSSTFKLGKSEGSGEGHAMNRLRKDETAIKEKDKPRDIDTISEDAQTLLDVVAKSKVLGMPEYAFSIHHWIELLQLNFPYLMSTYGHKIVAPLLESEIDPLHKTQLKKEKVKGVKSHSDLLKHFGYGVSRKDTRQGNTSIKLVKRGGLTIPTVDLRGLTTDFTANVMVAPLLFSTSVMRITQIEGSTPVKIQMDAYAAENIGVKAIFLSDQDRPKTKFKKTQRSHTVAWTLVRHHIMSFADKPISILMAMLERNFTGLRKDITDAKGKTLVAKAREMIKIQKGTLLTPGEWQECMSTLVRWYAICYQVAESSTFTHPTEKRPKGHGEAPAMVLLRHNEMTLENEEKLLDPVEEVAEKAAKLFDGYITDDLDEDDIVHAFNHWKEAISESFPLIWKFCHAELEKVMKKRYVTMGKRPKRLSHFI
jgi:hypothetical protein